MTNPFAAAINALSVSLGELEYAGEETDGVKEAMAQVCAAIRFLEAAGKVDKEAALSLWRGSEIYHTVQPSPADRPIHIVDYATGHSIMTLLDALPDPAQKETK